MRRIELVAVLLALNLCSIAAASAERVKQEDFYDLFLQKQPLGRMTVQELEIEEAGTELEAARVKMTMKINRLGKPVEFGMDRLEVYAPDGRVTRFRSDTRMSGVTQTSEGTVQDGVCRIVARDELTGQEKATTATWDTEAISEKQSEAAYEKLIHGPVGGQISQKVFVLDVLRSVETTSTLKAIEPMETHFGRRELYKVQIDMNLGVLLKSNVWVDAEGDLYLQEIALGPFQFRASRVSGDAPRPPSELGAAPEAFEQTIFRSTLPIDDPQSARSAVYLLQFKEGERPAIYEDNAQRVLNVSGRDLRLEVRSKGPQNAVPISSLKPPSSGDSCLKPSPYIQSNDPAIQKAARDTLGGETDAWSAAKALEKWVDGHVREKNLSVAFASAREVLDSGEGDCTEHALLLTALCRAAGIPARPAQGLVYAESVAGFGFHMWTEVYIGGAWHDLDATRPQPLTDATHIQLGAEGEGATLISDLSLQLLNSFGQFTLEVESMNE